MENFEELLKKELDTLPYEKHADDGGYNDGRVAGFEIGARWAKSLYDDKALDLVKRLDALEGTVEELKKSVYYIGASVQSNYCRCWGTVFSSNGICNACGKPVYSISLQASTGTVPPATHGDIH